MVCVLLKIALASRYENGTKQRNIQLTLGMGWIIIYVTINIYVEGKQWVKSLILIYVCSVFICRHRSNSFWNSAADNQRTFCCNNLWQNNCWSNWHIFFFWNQLFFGSESCQFPRSFLTGARLSFGLNRLGLL